MGAVLPADVPGVRQAEKRSFTRAVACSVCSRRSRAIYPRARRLQLRLDSGNSCSSAPSSPSLHARSSSVTAPGDGVPTASRAEVSLISERRRMAKVAFSRLQ